MENLDPQFHVLHSRAWRCAHYLKELGTKGRGGTWTKEKGREQGREPRLEGRIERLRVQLAYRFEACTPHQ